MEEKKRTKGKTTWTTELSVLNIISKRNEINRQLFFFFNIIHITGSFSYFPYYPFVHVYHLLPLHLVCKGYSIASYTTCTYALVNQDLEKVSKFPEVSSVYITQLVLQSVSCYCTLNDNVFTCQSAPVCVLEFLEIVIRNSISFIFLV